MLRTLLTIGGFVLFTVGPLLAYRAGTAVRRRVLRRTWLRLDNHVVPDPIRAHKTAQVVVRIDNGNALFTGITLGRAYSVDSAAQCPLRRCQPPGLDCECGFYAYKFREDALQLFYERLAFNGLRSKALLTVELSGQVLQYELGYRAQHQVVHRVEFNRWCARCHDGRQARPAVALAAGPRHLLEPLGPWTPPAHLAPMVSAMADHLPVYPVCEAHRPSAPRTFHFQPVDLANLLGTEVLWLSEASAQQPEG